jgi:mono/diheme cytochrome c family protein
MISRGLFTSIVVMLFGLVPGLVQAADEAKLPDFKKDVLPILQSHCVSCHGPKKQEGRMRLDNLSTDLIKDRAAAEYWHEVLNVLNAGEMPPEGLPQLSDKQRATITRWTSAAIKKSLDARRNTDGRVVLRRLNRVEYQNTMQDLLGLEMDYSRDLPPDAVSADGFRNNGQSLRMSALQLEYYLLTARRALDRVIVSGPAPKQHDYEFKESNVTEWLGNPQRSNRLGRKQVFLGTMPKDYPEEGEFLVRVTLTAELKPKVGYPLLEVAVGYRPDTKVLFREFDLVEITSSDEQVFEFRGRQENFPLPVREQGKYPGLVVRVRNVYSDGSPLPKANPKPKGKKKNKKKGTTFPEEPHLPTLVMKSVEFHGPIFDKWPPANHRRILFESPLRETDEAAYVTQVLQRFMTRAFRRPVEKSEVEKMVAFYKSIRPDLPTFEETIRETLAMVLVRPDFLYLLEPAGNKKRPVSDWELASRLSYFLWSTMPDEQLTKQAASGKLRDPKVLSVEVSRMLNDPRSSRFVEQFTEQWLKLNVVDSVAVSREYYPKFDNRLKEDMRDETRHFFGELLYQNLSALNLLSSDFTMLNEPLAKHYGIEDVLGHTFRRVPLKPGSHRGGLLGHASVLLSNSTGADSHAVRRAVWIRDRLLNDPPAPPPPDVPALDEADPKFLKLSVREQLKVHRGTKACASCHRGIDPWGIALENFDAVGLWRKEIRRKTGKTFETLPVIAKDTLPNGVELDGVKRLKSHLVADRKDDFARSLVLRLLTYSVGRRLELSDQQAVDQLVAQFVSDDYRLRDLIHKVVISPPFQTK